MSRRARGISTSRIASSRRAHDPTSGLEAGAAIARQALAALGQRPLLFAAVYGAHLLFAVAGWGIAALLLGPDLAGRPAPDLAEWALLARVKQAEAVRGAAIAAALVGAYWLAGTALATIVLRHLRRLPPLSRFWRCWARLLLLRAAQAVLVGALLLGWWLAAAGLYQLSLRWPDDRLHAAIQAATALCFALPCLSVLVIGHYAQLLAAAGQGGMKAVRGSLQLLRRRLGLATLLYLFGWASWAALTLPGWGAGAGELVVAQVAVLARVALHLWVCAAAWALFDVS